jgi:DNA-binding transcriptional regulator LsrR (DeoR family)
MIAGPSDAMEAVGWDLQETFDLNRVIIDPTVRRDADATKARVGEAGARCLEELLKEGTSLARA